MTRENVSPAPDHTRRGGTGPEGPPDRTEEYVISVGDVLDEHDPEPPVGTVVMLLDGSDEKWRRMERSGSGAEWCWGAEHNGWQPAWRWRRITFDGRVYVVEVPAPAGLADVSGEDVPTSSEDVKPGSFVTRHRLVTVDGQTQVEFQNPATDQWEVADPEDQPWPILDQEEWKRRRNLGEDV